MIRRNYGKQSEGRRMVGSVGKVEFRPGRGGYSTSREVVLTPGKGYSGGAGASQSRCTQKASLSRNKPLQYSNLRPQSSSPGNLALSTTIEKLRGQLQNRPSITVTPSKESTSHTQRTPRSQGDKDVEVLEVVAMPSPRKVLEVVTPTKAEVNDALSGLPIGITVSRTVDSPEKSARSPPPDNSESKNVVDVSPVGQEETSDTTQPQRVLELLLSAGLTPNTPISILERVSPQAKDHQAKSTVELLLDQVSQIRNLHSQLSVTHKQVLNLSPSPRRPSVDTPTTPSPQDQSYNTLLSLLSKLPRAELLQLEDRLTTQHTGVSPEKLLTQSHPDKSTSSTLEELSPTMAALPNNRKIVSKAGTTGGGWRVWTGELGQLGSVWQLTVHPPKGQGKVKTFDVDKSYLRELGLENTRTKNLRTTDAAESNDEVKLFFGSKFLSVPKSEFQEEEGMKEQENSISIMKEYTT